MVGIGIIIGALIVVIIAGLIYGARLIEERDRLLAENVRLKAGRGE